jgi:hypothetical protein
MTAGVTAGGHIRGAWGEPGKKGAILVLAVARPAACGSTVHLLPPPLQRGTPIPSYALHTLIALAARFPGASHQCARHTRVAEFPRGVRRRQQIIGHPSDSTKHEATPGQQSYRPPAPASQPTPTTPHQTCKHCEMVRQHHHYVRNAALHRHFQPSRMPIALICAKGYTQSAPGTAGSASDGTASPLYC